MRYLPQVLAGIVGATLFTSQLAHADDSVVVVDPQERDSTVVTTTNTPVIASGLMLFGLSYGGAVAAASLSENEADERMFVPIVGPWLALNDRGDCPIEDQSCDRETTEKILIGADGVLQAAGLAIAIYGILTPRTVVDDDVVVAPISMPNGGRGLGLSGSF